MGLVIDVLCNDGSPLGISPDTIWSRGVGGAELSLMTWAEEMGSRGHAVTIYNDPDREGFHGNVCYSPKGAWRVKRPDRDVLLLWRSPHKDLRRSTAGLKVWWSTDQYTVGDFREDILPFVDWTVCISPYHRDYHIERYGADQKRTIFIDLGVRLMDYDALYDGAPPERVPGRCLYCSVPDRGLDVLHLAWPKIRELRPDAELIITGDYTLWGAQPGDMQHRLKWLHTEGVQYKGAVNRRDLMHYQMTSQVHSYPCTYEELFCISAAECQVAGAMPVTTEVGALQTTNQWGLRVPGSPGDKGWLDSFASAVVQAMDMPTTAMRYDSRMRFGWAGICDRWERVLNPGHPYPVTEAEELMA